MTAPPCAISLSYCHRNIRYLAIECENTDTDPTGATHDAVREGRRVSLRLSVHSDISVCRQQNDQSLPQLVLL